MNETVSRSTRDTGYAAFAFLLGGVLGTRLGLNAEETFALSTALMAVFSFGWRALRKFAPWVTEG